MTLQEFNLQSAAEIKQQLFQCCGSTAWTENMLKGIPYTTTAALIDNADKAWDKTGEDDWREAFTHHPKIGDIQSLKEKFVSTQHWTTTEQGSVSAATDNVLTELKELNDAYHAKFGFIFIICATGKSALEMLDALKQRINNLPFNEIRIAAEEQRKIMHLRILKLLS